MRSGFRNWLLGKFSLVFGLSQAAATSTSTSTSILADPLTDNARAFGGWATYDNVTSCRIPDDHMVACETNAGVPGTSPSWPA